MAAYYFKMIIGANTVDVANGNWDNIPKAVVAFAKTAIDEATEDLRGALPEAADRGNLGEFLDKVGGNIIVTAPAEFLKYFMAPSSAMKILKSRQEYRRHSDRRWGLKVCEEN